MLGWLKDKVTGGTSAQAEEALRAQFKPLEEIQGVKPRLVSRLISYIFTGKGDAVVAELAGMPDTHFTFASPYHFFGEKKKTSGLALLVKLLPHNPELYLRLAKVYDAAYQPGAGVVYYYNPTPIPVFTGPLNWLGSFLSELSREQAKETPSLPVELVLQMLRADDQDPDMLIKGAFFYEDAQGKNTATRYMRAAYTYFQNLTGFADLVLSSPDIVRPAFRQKDAFSRSAVLKGFLALRISPDPFAEDIARLSVGGSKDVREQALPLVTQSFRLCAPFLKQHAEQGSADERFHAVRLLGRIGDDDERAFLTQRMEIEKSEKVRDAIRDLLSGPVTKEAENVPDDFGLSPVAEIDPNAPLDKEVLKDLRQRLQETERRTAENFAQMQMGQYKWKRTPVAPEVADILFDRLQTLVVKKGTKFPYFESSNGVDFQLLQSYVIPPQFKLIHLVRWCLLLTTGRKGVVGEIDPWTISRWRRAFVSYQKVKKTAIDLRELAAVFRAIGVDDRHFGRHLLFSRHEITRPFLRSDPETIWPYFAERLDLIEEALGMKESDSTRSYWEAEQRQNAFDVLKLFPRVPGRFVSMLWDIALGSGKTERPFAQECLDKFPNKETKILAALAGRQQDARLAAAQWLGTLQYTEAIPDLRRALSKEKNEIVKDELIKTLESMGIKLEDLLDLSKLDDEARKGLGKGIPKDLEWFPFTQLPGVRWADSGETVSTEILHWFLVQGYRVKNAEANPTLRRYCSLFLKDDREKLGRFVLEAWIAKDTQPKYTAEQASAEARKEAQQTAVYAKQYPQYYPEFSEERFYQTRFNWLVSEPAGSQNNTKGILALSGACCGGEAAPIVHRYIKQWFGYRAAQCKALLQVLAWIDDPSATQVILSVANRFRTKGIQEEALRQCQLLAERKGWTMDELADRTIPTASLDETGTMQLDYGSRQFTASLSEELTITITNQNGKVIASLPDANQSDDPDQVKQAKATLSNARKELKSVIAMQKDRLYEALCTQRTWRFEDWNTYLRQHPIVGRYCQRLVWTAYDDDKLISSFRPLADGTLTDHHDDEVTLNAETAVRLGHDETLAADDRTAWLQHFSDYEVEPLFQQFGKARFVLPDKMKDDTEIKDFLGHIVKAFSLRNRLTRLGYTRGAAQDAGWFFEYKKTFLSLGIEATIEFTGNGLPEENRTVALQRLYFTRKLDDEQGLELALGELPRVLLAECWNDIRMAAADGTGFAADWQKQVEV